MLGRHAVVDRNDSAQRGVGDFTANPVVAVEIAQHPTATVIVDVDRERAHVGGAGAPIDADGNWAMRPGRVVLLHTIDLRQLRLRHHAAAPEHLLGLHGGKRVDRRPSKLLDQIEEGL